MAKKKVCPSSFGLQYNAPGNFTLCVFQKRNRASPWFLTYRLIMALYFVLAIIVGVAEYDAEGFFKHFIYLTNLTFFIETVTYVTGCILIIRRYARERKYLQALSQAQSQAQLPVQSQSQSPGAKKQSEVKSKDTKDNKSLQGSDKNSEKFKRNQSSVAISRSEIHSSSHHIRLKMTHSLKFFWVLYTVTLPTSVGISIIFWSTLYSPEGYPNFPKNVVFHITNGVFILIDFFIIVHPVRVLHFYMPLTFGFVYCVFSLIYQFSGGTGWQGKIAMYSVLNWELPVKALLMCVYSVEMKAQLFVAQVYMVEPLSRMMDLTLVKWRPTRATLKTTNIDSVELLLFNKKDRKS